MFKVGDNVRILTPKEYFLKTGRDVPMQCAMTFFSNQNAVVTKVECDKYRGDTYRIELCHSGFLQMLQKDFGYNDISFYWWREDQLELTECSQEQVSQDEFDSIMFG